MDDECCIFMLFFLFRILSEDWYTWMLRSREITGKQALLGLDWVKLKPFRSQGVPEYKFY